MPHTYVVFQLKTWENNHEKFKDSDFDDDLQPEVAIWPPKNRSIRSRNSNGKPEFPTRARSMKVFAIKSLRQRQITGSSQQRNRNTYIAETTTNGIIEIPTASLEFATTYRARKSVGIGDCNSDQNRK